MYAYSDKNFVVFTFVLCGLCNVYAITFHHDGHGGWRQGGFQHNNDVHPPKNARTFGPNFNNIETYRVIHEGVGHSYQSPKRASHQRTVKLLHNDIPSYENLPSHGQINHVQVQKTEPNGKTYFHTIKVIHEIATPAASNNVHTVSQLHTKVTPSSSVKNRFWSRPAYPQYDIDHFHLKK